MNQVGVQVRKHESTLHTKEQHFFRFQSLFYGTMSNDVNTSNSLLTRDVFVFLQIHKPILCQIPVDSFRS